MKTALGYVRISKEEEGSVSLDYQQAEIEKLCHTNGLTLLAVECDEGISGEFLAKRPGIQRVLQAVDQRTVDAVVVWKSDRVSRDGIESLQVEKLFLKRGVAYLSCTEGNLTADSVDDEFMRFIRAGLNQRERKLISLRTRQALSRLRDKGKRIGGRPAYGWHVVNGELVLEPSEQRAISRMKELQAMGYTTRGIVKALREEGYRTRKGTCFNQTQVLRVLRKAA
jgi:site-specific DNA recombinase